jgi:hypothetical protein
LSSGSRSLATSGSSHVNDISTTLYFLSRHAHQHGDYAWLRRHRWWLNATTRLFNGEPAVPLDG